MANSLEPKTLGEHVARLTLEDEIRQLVRRHGEDKIRAALKRVTVKKRGRKAEKDWLLLAPHIERDAVDWLNGANPFEKRSNFSIAKVVSQSHPGQSEPSTHRRLMRKLAEGRERMLYYAAMTIAEEERPYHDLMRALYGLAQFDGPPNRIAMASLDRRIGQLTRYEESFGTPPHDMTFPQIEARLASLTKLPRPNAMLGGIFGKWPA